MVATGIYSTLSNIMKQLQQEVYIQKKGLYRVGICLAVCGPCIWYGRLQPYLNEIELHEHYYVHGPSGCQGEAIELCAQIGNKTRYKCAVYALALNMRKTCYGLQNEH